MKKFAFYTLAPIAIWLAGCSHLEVNEIPVTADPSEEISKLEVEQANALAQQGDVLSPRNFNDVKESLAAAKKSRADGEDTKVILRDVAEGRAYLVKLNEVAKISRSTIPKVVEQRANALTANANTVLKEDFNDADSDLVDMSRDIEDGDLATANQNRDRLAQRYADLELRAIKKEQLSAAIATIDQAKKEGATENAPQTLALAQKALKDADAFITNNRHDNAGIATQAQLATDAANRLVTISRKVKVDNKNDGESVVLNREAQSKQLNAASAVIDTKNSDLAASSAAKKKLTSENAKMELRTQETARLEKAKAQFSPADADVYQDGDRLIIRLKTIAFPSGKAVLTPSSFPILGQVQKVIKDLGPSRISVQGHTDSNGNKTNNQKLSETRASAISSYLSSNGVDADSIDTVGFGDTKPLAVNNTKEGRAQNRRVDVVITPEASTH